MIYQKICAKVTIKNEETAVSTSMRLIGFFIN